MWVSVCFASVEFAERMLESKLVKRDGCYSKCENIVIVVWLTPTLRLLQNENCSVLANLLGVVYGSLDNCHVTVTIFPENIHFDDVKFSEKKLTTRTNCPTLVHSQGDMACCSAACSCRTQRFRRSGGSCRATMRSSFPLTDGQVMQEAGPSSLRQVSQA